jgi:hypothetical protein
MLISLSIMAVAAALAAHAAVVQLRFYRGAGELIRLRGQLGAVGAIMASTLRGVSAQAGDVVFAADSALEVRASLGAAVACETAVGRVVTPAPEERGNTLSGFESPPGPGDIVDIFTADSLGSGWLRATVASTEVGGRCALFPAAAGATVLSLNEPLVIPAGAFVSVVRPVRMSHYRASDGLWYFGVRDWNSASQQLNTVQPVAGPLEPHRADAASGLTFRYFDAAGSELIAPADLSRIAAVQVTTRAKSQTPPNVSGLARLPASAESATATVALRNAR